MIGLAWLLAGALDSWLVADLLNGCGMGDLVSLLSGVRVILRSVYAFSSAFATLLPSFPVVDFSCWATMCCFIAAKVHDSSLMPLSAFCVGAGFFFGCAPKESFWGWFLSRLMSS